MLGEESICCTFFPKFTFLQASERAIGFSLTISEANPGPERTENSFLSRNFSAISVWNKQYFVSIPLEQKTSGLFLNELKLIAKKSNILCALIQSKMTSEFSTTLFNDLIIFKLGFNLLIKIPSFKLFIFSTSSFLFVCVLFQR